jgi:hypothetical protein
MVGEMWVRYDDFLFLSCLILWFFWVTGNGNGDQGR